MRKRIHVNMHVIRDNQKSGARNPPLTVKMANALSRAYAAHIQGPSHVIYSPDKPLQCGARVWIEVADGVPVHLLDAEGNVTEELI